MPNYIMGVDIGTTGAKCMIFDLSGALICKSYREYKCTYHIPVWVDQNPNLLIHAMMGACKDAIEHSGIDAGSIQSLGISCQRCCVVFVDEQGDAMKMISWQDSRATKQVEAMERLVDAGTFYDKTGLPLSSTWIIPKLMWVKENEPQLWKKTAKVVQFHDYVLKKLGASGYYLPTTDACFYGAWNVRKSEWDAEYTKLFQFQPKDTSEIKRPGQQVGVLSRTASEKTGLPYGLPLCVGAGDQSCAALGSGAIQEGDVSVSMGTGGMCIICIDSYKQDPNRAFYTTNHVIPGKWQWEGLQKGSASVFRWFKDEIATLEREVCTRQHKNVYQALDLLVEKTPVGSKGLILLPYFASSATPHWDSNARGALIGMTLAHDRGCLVRSFLEGITMEQREMLCCAESLNLPISRVRIMGGPTKSPIWNQIQADIYGRPVETLCVTDAAVLGGAIIGAVGCGIFPDYEAAVNSMVRMDKIYYPNPDAAEQYETLFKAFRQAYADLRKGTFPMLAEIQRDDKVPSM